MPELIDAVVIFCTIAAGCIAILTAAGLGQR